MRDILPLFQEMEASQVWRREVAERDGLAPADLIDAPDLAGPMRDELMMGKASLAWNAALDMVEDARGQHGLDRSECATLREMAKARYEEAWGLWSSSLGPLGWLAAFESRELAGAAQAAKPREPAGRRL